MKTAAKSLVGKIMRIFYGFAPNGFAKSPPHPSPTIGAVKQHHCAGGFGGEAFPPSGIPCGPFAAGAI
jgi:hypothetical protein